MEGCQLVPLQADLELVQEWTVSENLDMPIRYIETVTKEAGLGQGGKSTSRQGKRAEE